MAPEMGRSRFTIIKLLFACFIYCCLSAIIDQHPNPASYQFAQALVYHKYQPATPVLSRVNRQPANISASDSFYHNYQVPAYNRQQQQQQQLQKQQPPISYLTSSESSDESEFYGCPRECHCNDVAHIADCSDRNLTRVPARFPKDIRRIRLERNNITEIGPFAFQGLKRLQRIDLSNNNLHKIDTLAFSGGLRTLNTLILFNNKLEHLPVNVFSELSNLQILLLNANSLQTIHKDLFQSLTSLNLLSLYDNNIVSLASGTFDALKNVKTIHLGKNPLNCDCSLRWIVDYFEANPTVETSEASCKLPVKSQGLRLTQLNKNDMKCQEPVPSRGPIGADLPSSCPAGCVCSGSTVDCSRVSPSGPLAAESPALGAPGGGLYELPDVPEDLPVYVARVHINDNRIKRIRQTGLFKKLANSQKLDLGNNKIVDIEDNAINGHLPNGQKPERVIFVLLENQHCENVNVTNKRTANNHLSSDGPTTRSGLQHDSSDDDRQTACATAPKVNDPVFDSPCYNGGTCRSDGSHSNFTCQCPLGFGGPLCEINIDDCVDHQCQNGAMCVDGINSYKCICRDPTTSGEFCEQLSSATNNNLYNSLGASFGMPYNPTSGASSSNAIAPLALPIIAQASNAGLVSQSNDLSPSEQQHRSHQPQILARSADFLRQPDDLASNSLQQSNAGIGKGEKTCHRATSSKYFDDGNGCQSVRLLKISECVGACDSKSGGGCCAPTKIKRRRIHMQCSDGASYVKVVDLIKKCSCSQEANSCPAALNDLLPVSQSTTRGAPLSFAPSVRTSTRSPPTTTTALYQQYYKYSTGSDQQVPPSPVVNRGQLNGGASSQEDQITQLDAVE